MHIKIFIFILIIWTKFHLSVGQNEFLMCGFSYSNYIYTCSLMIFNPNGLDNFTKIEGTHLSGYSDGHVTHITRGKIISSPILPSIICEKFKNIQKIVFTPSEIEKITEKISKIVQIFLDLCYSKII